MFGGCGKGVLVGFWSEMTGDLCTEDPFGKGQREVNVG